jgi:hypothetical protein
MNKQIFTLAIMVIIGTYCYAQPERGDVFIGGNISAGFKNHSEGGRKTDAQGGMSMDILIGAVLDKGWVIGSGPRYGNYFDADFDAFGNKVIRFGVHSVGPTLFIRKYTRIADKFYLRTGITNAYTLNMHTARLFPSKDKTDLTFSHTVDLRLRAALAIFPSPNVGIEFSYGELFYRADFAHVREPADKTITNNVGFKYGVEGLEISLTYFIRSKKEKEADKR